MWLMLTALMIGWTCGRAELQSAQQSASAPAGMNRTSIVFRITAWRYLIPVSHLLGNKHMVPKMTSMERGSASLRTEQARKSNTNSDFEM